LTQQRHYKYTLQWN